MRTGMSDLVQTVRELTFSGTADFTIGTVSYFSNDHIENVLDDHRTDIQFMDTFKRPEQAAGSIIYKDVEIPTNTESGTVFYLQTSGGTVVGTSLYSVDHQRGIVSFTNDTAGTAFFVTCRQYDVYGAVADIWEQKAASVAGQVDWSSDNHSFKNSQMFNFYTKQAQKYRGMAQPISAEIYRGDTCL